jgi:hypothetical protein
LGFGIVIACAGLLFLRRHHIFSPRACLVGPDAAYLANAAALPSCLWRATGTVTSKSGWLLTMGIVWPMARELVSIFIETLRTQLSHHISRIR